MTNPELSEPKKHGESPEPAMASPAAPPGAADVENPATEVGVTGVMRRWRIGDMLNRGSLLLRGLGFLFSLLAFIVMASNQHGDWKDFDKYEEYRYVLAIAILSTLYTGLQAFRQVHELSTGKEILSRRNVSLLDFFGDQITAYLLLSSASSAVPLTNRMRDGADNSFTDSSAVAISMEFLAFLALALSAIISGYKLSQLSYI